MMESDRKSPKEMAISAILNLTDEECSKILSILENKKAQTVSAE